MKRLVAGAAILAGTVAMVHRFAPRLHERAVKRCQAMMTRQAGLLPMDRAA
jgi:hypothetical protein